MYVYDSSTKYKKRKMISSEYLNAKLNVEQIIGHLLINKYS